MRFFLARKAPPKWRRPPRWREHLPKKVRLGQATLLSHQFLVHSVTPDIRARTHIYARNCHRARFRPITPGYARFSTQWGKLFGGGGHHPLGVLSGKIITFSSDGEMEMHMSAYRHLVKRLLFFGGLQHVPFLPPESCQFFHSFSYPRRKPCI